MVDIFSLVLGDGPASPADAFPSESPAACGLIPSTDDGEVRLTGYGSAEGGGQIVVNGWRKTTNGPGNVIWISPM